MVYRVARESFGKKHTRALKILRLLKKRYPHAKIILNYSNHHELLFAVMLSAQCTDKVVNEVTKMLFKKYRALKEYANANLKELERDVKRTGFYRAKARHIKESAEMLLARFGGNVPDTMDELLELPGVARKTANVVLGNAFKRVQGIAVDTHVRRLSERFGLTKEEDPVKIEQDLMKLLPKRDWFKTTYLLIDHGRALCTARNRKCSECPLTDLCPSSLV
ncbi:MAG: endonuclease III [Parcubacteria group bacterium]|nr:endonuclease III [Parcubacteria group bacterium]